MGTWRWIQGFLLGNESSNRVGIIVDRDLKENRAIAVEILNAVTVDAP